MTGMRGRKSPVLSWHVKPAWNPNTWKETKKKRQGGMEEDREGEKDDRKKRSRNETSAVYKWNHLLDPQMKHMSALIEFKQLLKRKHRSSIVVLSSLSPLNQFDLICLQLNCQVKNVRLQALALMEKLNNLVNHVYCTHSFQQVPLCSNLCAKLNHGNWCTFLILQTATDSCRAIFPCVFQDTYCMITQRRWCSHCMGV